VREVAGATAVLGVIFIVLGLPSAVLLREKADGWVAALVDAAIHGLLWLPLAVTAWAWLGWWGLGVVVAAWVATVVAVVRGRMWPAVRRLQASRTDLAYGAGWLGVLGVAALLRLREVNFISWVGDMGAYVNWANEFVRTGVLHASWPPLFPSYLAVSTFLFGPAHTTIGMAATGLVLVLAMARLLMALRADRWLALAGAAAVAVSVHAVWYSSFPSSESLNAPILLLWLILMLRVLRADRGRDLPAIVGTGVAMLALSLVRGSGGMLLIPLGGALVLVLLVRAWRGVALALWKVTAACTLAALIAYWYGISKIRPYFVVMQFQDMVSESLWARIKDFSLFNPTPATAVVLVLAVAVFLVAGTVLVRWVAGHAGVEGRREWASKIVFVGLAALLAFFVVRQVLDGGQVWTILQRMGSWLVVGGVVALAATAFVRQRAEQAVVMTAGLTVIFFIKLHSIRFMGAPVTHSFYLYWDRYLVSEVLPLLTVLTFLGLTLLVRGAVSWINVKGGKVISTELVAAGVGLVLLALVVPPTAPTLRVTTQDTYMRGAYTMTHEIADLVGKPSTPVYWSADAAGIPPGFFFPNTWMAFAVPMEMSFGYNFINADRTKESDFAHDDVLSAKNVATVAACSGDASFVAADVEVGGPPLDQRLAGSGATAKKLGTAEEPVLFLQQPAGPRGWYSVDFEVTAWRVTVPAAVQPAKPVCP